MRLKNLTGKRVRIEHMNKAKHLNTIHGILIMRKQRLRNNDGF
jgi:hypothetical protein